MAHCVHLSITQHFFQDFLIIIIINFLTLCMKLRDHQYSKLTSNFFLENLYLPEIGSKGPEQPSLSISSLIQHFSQNWQISFFLIFCMKLKDHKYFKLTEPNYLGKFLLARKWAKKAENGPVCQFAVLQHFSQDWLISFFWTFCMNLRDHKYSKLRDANYLRKFSLA